MPFEIPAHEVPKALRADAFILRPIRAQDAEADYAAVMESRELLRSWEQSTWPEDDFTVAANREDLEMLERRHGLGHAFTYTVEPAEQADSDACLGCVYIMSTDAGMFRSAQITAVGETRWEDFDAGVYFWVRQSQLASGLERALLDALRTWFDDAWPLRPLFVASEDYAHQLDIVEGTDLEQSFVIKEAGKTGRYVAYAEPDQRD